MKKHLKSIKIAAVILVLFSLVYAGLSYYMMQMVTEPKVETYETIKNRIADKTGIKVDTLPFEQEKITTSDDMKIDTYTYKNPKPSGKVIILSHGIRQNAQSMFVFFNLYDKLGFDIVGFSYRNHGESTKSVTTFGKNEVKDLEAVMNYAHQKFGSEVRYGIHGISMGSAIMLQYAKQTAKNRQYDFLVSDCSFSDLGMLLETRLKEDYSAISFLPLVQSASSISSMNGRFDFYSIKPKEDIANIDVPVLIVHGKSDNYIPLNHAYQLFDAKKDKKHLLIIDGAPHADSYFYNPSAYDEAVMKLIEEVS